MSNSNIVKRVVPENTIGYELYKDDAGEFLVVLPEESINYIKNPSVQINDLTGYSSALNNIARSSSDQLFGLFSLRAYGDGVHTAPLLVDYVTDVVDSVNRQIYTFSYYIKVKAGSIIRTYVVLDPMGATPSQNRIVSSGGWQRIKLTFSGSGSGFTIRFVIHVLTPVLEFFVDALQMEKKAYATTYFDGSMVDDSVVSPNNLYWWDIVPYKSYSHRSQFALNGGRPISLWDYGFKMLGFVGLGLSIPSHIFDQLANGVGFYDKTVYTPRDFTIAGMVFGTDYEDLRVKVNGIETLLNQFGMLYSGPMTVIYRRYDRYKSPISEMFIRCYYINGVEGNVDNLYQERFGIIFRQSDPAIVSTGIEASSIYREVALTDTGPLLRIGADGIVKSIDFSASWNKEMDDVFAIETVPSNYDEFPGEIIIGGNFLEGTSQPYLAVKDGDSWGYLGIEMSDPYTGVNPSHGSAKVGVHAICIGNDGNIYFGGRFEVSGHTPKCIYYYDYLWTLHEMGSGVTGPASYNYRIVTDIVVYRGEIFIIGTFTEMGGVASTAYIAKWNGSVFSSIGVLDSSPGFYAKMAVYGGYLIVSGAHSGANGVPSTAYISRYSPEQGWGFWTLLNGPVTAIYASYPYLFISGSFTTVNTVSMPYTAYFDGSQWHHINITVFSSYIVEKIFGGPSNTIVFVGSFYLKFADQTFKFPAMYMQIGQSKMYPFPCAVDQYVVDPVLPDAGLESVVHTGMMQPSGMLYFAGRLDSDQYTIIQDVNNASDDIVYPTFVIFGPGEIMGITNHTNSKIIRFNALTLNSGEVLIIVFTQYGVSSSSNMRSTDSIFSVQTDIDMFLNRGNNKISVSFISGTSGNTGAYIKYQNRYLRLKIQNE